MIKTSPLSGIYRSHQVQLTEVSGWEIAQHFAYSESEKRNLREGAVLADWSHIGKISLSRGEAPKEAEKVLPGAAAIAPLNSCVNAECTVLRLTGNDYLILCLPGLETDLLEKLDRNQTTVINQTGGQGCFALAGPRRDEVLERSTAVNLRRDLFKPGMVLQSTVHTIPCTVYRTDTRDILVHPRTLSESLFEALMDVGMGVGLAPAGVGTLPVSFILEEE